MNDEFPTIDAEFFIPLIRSSGRILGEVTIGSTSAFFLIGTAPLFKRTFHITRTPQDQIGYISATGAAFRLGLMEPLLRWLEENRDWRDGGFFVRE